MTAEFKNKATFEFDIFEKLKNTVVQNEFLWDIVKPKCEVIPEKYFLNFENKHHF